MSRRFKIITLSFGLLLVVAVGWILLFADNSGDELPRYNEAKISRGALKAEVSATGTLSPVITVLVGSQVSGTIQHLYANFNSRVTKGEVIAVAFLFATLVGIFFGLHPARKASRMRPIEALRYE